jgi:hypothetical protein
MEPDIETQVRGLVAFLDAKFRDFDEHQREFLQAEAEAGAEQGGDDEASTADMLALTLSDLRDATSGLIPMLLTLVEPCPEHDTDGRAGFLVEWELVGGSEPIKIVSLAPREMLPAFAHLAMRMAREESVDDDDDQ